jgi:hypothetical protein
MARRQKIEEKSVEIVNLSAFNPRRWHRLRRYLVQNKFVVFIILLLLIFGILSLLAIIPSTHLFEGNLIVEEMSFIYNGDQPKLFLNGIDDITNIESEGIQTLSFTGTFQSQTHPELNHLNKPLKIELTNRKSKWIIQELENSKNSSQIELTELRLQPHTKVAGLSYDAQRNQLALSLQPNQSQKNQPNTLELYLGEKPLKVILEGYKLPNLKLNKLNNHENNGQILEFTLIPDNPQFKLEIEKNNTINITTPTPPKDDSEQWFRGKIDTQNVQFQRLDRTGIDINDDLAISTIMEGKIRMIEQEKEIKKNQFLMGEKPDLPLNIQRIRYLQIADKKGIEVGVSGKTKQIKIGLDKEFPVSIIQGSPLDGVLPRDAIVALFSFGAGTVTSLLTFVIENALQSSSE